MLLFSSALKDGQAIPGDNAMGIPGDEGPQPGPNKSPPLEWDEIPPGTRSFALICVDIDAPDKADANRDDRSIAYDAPRGDFYHWVLVDIPRTTTSLAQGVDSDGVTPKGKPPGPTDHGVRGINSYKEWFGSDPDMGGDYGGYDGPWPPYNDERVHRYVFTLYALDEESLQLPSGFRGPDVLDAIQGRVLAQSSLTATYTLNPRAR